MSVLLMLALAIPALAEDFEYLLDDWFFVEAVYPPSLATEPETELWHVYLHRGVVISGKEFIFFRLVTIRVGRKDIKVFETNDSSPKTVFTAQTFRTEIDGPWRLFIEVAFNDDGSLRNLSGTLVDTIRPMAINYRLVREPRELQLKFSNPLASKTYNYHPRRQ
jgi:hypothetical protein